MKKFVTGIVFILFAGLVVTFTSCVSAPKVDPQDLGFDSEAQHGESEIIFTSSRPVSSFDKMSGVLSIYVDNELKLSVKPGYKAKVVIPNGSHSFHVDWIAKNGFGWNLLVKGEPITVNADSKRYEFRAALPVILHRSKVKLNQVSVNEL